MRRNRLLNDAFLHWATYVENQYSGDCLHTTFHQHVSKDCQPYHIDPFQLQNARDKLFVKSIGADVL